MSVHNRFTEEEKLQITNAIRVAETNTSGEIRVHIEKHCKGDVLDQAAGLNPRAPGRKQHIGIRLNLSFERFQIIDLIEGGKFQYVGIEGGETAHDAAA